MTPISSLVSAPFLIFLGPDGAGKSTQARWFSRKLRSEGLRTKTIWIRNFHFPFAYLLSRLFVAAGYVDRHEGYIERMSRFSIVLLPKLGRFWAFIEFTSLMPHVLFRVMLPRFLGYAVVTDRYTIDSSVAISYAIRDPDYVNLFFAQVLLATVPKDALVVYLRANPCVLGERRLAEERSLDFLNHQLWAYDKLVRQTKGLTLDMGHFKASEVRSIVMDALSSNGIALEKQSDCHMTRIAIVAPNGGADLAFGGGAYTAVQMASSLVKSGHEVLLLSAGGSRKNQTRRGAPHEPRAANQREW